MSEFEYASVVVSIVLALGIADILRFLADTLREPGARRLYWVHFVWILLLLQLHMEFWWRMWAFGDRITVGPELTMVLVGPALLFMASRILLPGPQDTSDMATLYFGHKNAFFSAIIATMLWSMITSGFAFPEDQRALLYASLALNAAVLLAFATCIFSANRRVHSVVVLAVAGLEIAELLSWMLGTMSS